MGRLGSPGLIIRTRTENAVLVLSDNIKRKAGVPPHTLVLVYIVNSGEPAIFKDRAVPGLENLVCGFKYFLMCRVSARPIIGSAPCKRLRGEDEGHQDYSDQKTIEQL